MFIDYSSLLISSDVFGVFAFVPLDEKRAKKLEGTIFFNFKRILPSRNQEENSTIMARELAEELLNKAKQHDFYIYRLEETNYVVYLVEKALSQADMGIVIEKLEEQLIKPPSNKAFEEFSYAALLKKNRNKKK